MANIQSKRFMAQNSIPLKASKSIRLAAILLAGLGLASASFAQTSIQSVACTASPCSLSSVKAGNELIVAEDSLDTVSDGADSFTAFGFYGAYGSNSPATFAYAKAAGGTVTITLGPNTKSLWLAEYPPMKFDVQSKVTYGTLPSPSVSATLTASDTVFLLFAYSNAGNPITSQVPSYALDVNETGVVLEESTAPTGHYSLSLPSAGYGAALIAFTLTGPRCPPANNLTFTVNVTLSWDDSTPTAPDPVIGSIVSDQTDCTGTFGSTQTDQIQASGSATITKAVNVQQQFVTLRFTLFDSTGAAVPGGIIQQTIPSQMLAVVPAGTYAASVVLKKGSNPLVVTSLSLQP